jgi:hypothetical protein
MPTYASAFHPEFAPPAAKRAQAPRRERHKHRTVGRAAHWLDECTSISDVSLPCPYDNAWKNYLAWCRAEELMPLSKGKFIRGVAARVGTHGKAFTGLVLAVPTETLRAVA